MECVSRVCTHQSSSGPDPEPYREEPLPPPREYDSVMPQVFPRITENTIHDYYIYWGVAVISFLVFGGFVAPLAEAGHVHAGHSLTDSLVRCIPLFASLQLLRGGA